MQKILLAADYGVPQLRRRLFIVGTRTDYAFDWPVQTHMGAVRRSNRPPARHSTTPTRVAHNGTYALPDESCMTPVYRQLGLLFERVA
ncbi:MAG: DNA cytosine methyltransferase [Acidimicrobiia bacterium]